MPRGRAGLTLIPPDQVRAALNGRSDQLVAFHFGVAWRTVRRWCMTGLPLEYGTTRISREKWDAFAKMPASKWAARAKQLHDRHRDECRGYWYRELRTW